MAVYISLSGAVRITRHVTFSIWDINLTELFWSISISEFMISGNTISLV